MLKKLAKHPNWFYLGVTIILSLVLFVLLYNKVLFTPDFGESDAYHFNFAMKYYLADSLKHNTIPFWTELIQGGYPLLSEGQIGAFYIPNVLLLKFLPYNAAYTMLFVTSFFLLTYGFYLLLRELKVSPGLAFLCALSFSFNGSLVFRLVHLNLVQAFSLAPYLFLFCIRLFKTFQKKYIVLYCLFLSQMVFAGYVPVVYVTLFGLFVWFMAIVFLKTKGDIVKIAKAIGLVLAINVVGLLLASPQLTISSLLTGSTSRKLEIPFNVVTHLPLSLSNLAGFFAPYLFGDPKYGTYPRFSADWGIFWENTPYVGGIFFFLFLVSVFYFLRRQRKSEMLVVSICSALLFAFLSLGKNSPLYFLFYYPPFNFFRTQSRFLMVVVLFMFIFVAQVLQNMTAKKSVILKGALSLLLLLNFMDLFWVAKNYHFWVDFNKAIEKPPIVSFMDKDHLFLSREQPAQWNKHYLKDGWAKKETQEKFIFYKNYIYPNSNLLYDRPGLSINSFGLALKRVDYLEGLLTTNFYLHSDHPEVPFIPSLFDLLDLKYVITSRKVQSPHFTPLKALPHEGESIHLAQYKRSRDSLFYIPTSVKKIGFQEEFENKLRDGTDLMKDALVEEQIVGLVEQSAPLKLQVLTQQPTQFSLKGNFGKNTFFVLRKNYYPEWEARANGKKITIYKVNLIHMGVLVPAGDTTVTFSYANHAFKRGMVVAALTLLSLLIFLTAGSSKLINRFKSGLDKLFD